jgi:pyrroline-5-carboxylate reductase
VSGARPAGIWLVGCGNMAGAMLRRWIDVGTVAPDRVFVANRQDRELPAGVRQGRAFPEGSLPAFVMLGVKPQQLGSVADQFGDVLTRAPILISILAGVEEATLRDRLRPAGAVVRAMPNLPVELGRGVVPLCSTTADADQRDRVSALMAPLGLVEWLDESRFDLVAALAGSGPAFLYRFIDALAAAGSALGFDAALAERLALATVEGSALLAARAGVSPGTLADRVASPGGSTREGLNVLDQDDALKTLLRETLAAATRRNAEMAAAARA